MNDIHIAYSLGEYQSDVDHALDKMRKDNIIERIWAKDYTLWKQSPDEITNRLGWLDAPKETLDKIEYLRKVLKPFTGGGTKDVVLLGMGGSSLAAEVFGKIFGPHTGYPQLQVLDTTDPAFILKVSQSLDLEKTLFVVSSKSGTTLEITSLFQYFYNLTLKKLGSSTGSHFIFITDEGSPMEKIAEKLSLYHTFLNNPHIGGRYSALSFPGIIPAAIIGVNVEKLLQKALATQQIEKEQNISGKLNASGACLGAVLGTLAQKGRDKLTLIMPPRWKSFGDWLEQLIAESTGKDGKGILPVLNEPAFDAAVYGRDRVFVIFQKEQENNSPKIDALTKAGHPVITIKINDDYDLGSQMFLWEMATAIAGHILSINPFVQPGVQATKNHTRRIIAQYGKTKTLPQQVPALATPECSVYGDFKGSSAVEALAGFLQQAKAGDYVCLQIFLSPSPEIDEALLKMREAIAAKYRLAVTLGYGPRYLHSTGQLHKDDSGNGLFIQLTADDLIDVDIPDKIGKDDSSLTFGTFKAAQAQGDWQALLDAGRRIIRLHCKKDAAADLNKFASSL
jgi:glucose-6-phosphate isomerase